MISMKCSKCGINTNKLIGSLCEECNDCCSPKYQVKALDIETFTKNNNNDKGDIFVWLKNNGYIATKTNQ